MLGGKNRARLAKLDLLAKAWGDTEMAFQKELQTSVTVRLMDSSGASKWDETWSSERAPPEGGWDWPTICDVSRGKPDEFCIAIWHKDTTSEAFCLQGN